MVHDLILKYNRQDLIIWGSKSYKDTLLLKKIDPNIKRWFSIWSYWKVHIAFILGFLPFVDFEEDSFQPPLYTKEFEMCKISEFDTKFEKFIVYLAFRILQFFTFIAKPLIWHMRKRGFLMYCFFNDNY